MRTRPRIVWLLVMTALVVGCSHDADPPPIHRPDAAAEVRPVDPRDVVMRPKSFFDDTETIVDATVRLTQACMRSKGFRYDGVAQVVDRNQGELEPDMDFHRAKGFGFADTYRPLYQPTDDIAAEYGLAFGGADDDVVEYQTIGGTAGTHAGGCFGDAKEHLAGSVLEWTWAVTTQQDYWLAFSFTSLGGNEWKDVIRRWSECMADAGWPDMEGPDDPHNAVAQRYMDTLVSGEEVPDDLRSFEIDLAVDDAACRTSTGVVDVSRSLREEFLASASPAYLRDLKRIATARTNALRTIRTEHLD